MTEAVRAARLTVATGEITFTFFLDGQPMEAYAGETIGAAMLVAGRRTIRRTGGRGDGRGLYCVMGACWECAVRVADRTVRACLEPAVPGLRVETLGGPRP